MAIQKKEFGVMPSGEKVYEYTLTNKSGVSASFIELGATWTKMLVPDRDGNMADVILGYGRSCKLSGKYTSFWRPHRQKCKPYWKRSDHH